MKKDNMLIRPWGEEQTLSERRRMRRSLSPLIGLAVVAMTMFAVWKGCGMKSIIVVIVYSVGAGWLFLETCITLNGIANTKRLSPLLSFLLGCGVTFCVTALISVVMVSVLHIAGILT